MKKKYQQPLIKVQIVEGEPLLNNGSVVGIDGNPQGSLGSSVGTEDETGTVWGDAKPYNPWTSWD